MDERWLKIACELLALPTAPLVEGAVAGWVRRFAEARGLGVEADRWGNLLVRYGRRQRGQRPLALCAHMDHPGFVAGGTGRDGLLRAWRRGGVPRDLIAGAKVRFFSDGRWLRGVVESVAKAERPGKGLPVTIRVAGAVAPGSPGMWDYPSPVVRGTRLYARGHDDVTGAAAICCALDEARRRKLTGEVLAFFTRGEELGMVGATGACREGSLPKDAVVVALETSRAFVHAPLGGGAVVRVGDKASIFSPDVTRMLWRAARKVAARDKRRRYQRRLMDGGTCESTTYGAWGYDAGGLCLPLGNYHNVDWDRMRLGPEFVDLGDYGSLVALLVALIGQGTKDLDKDGAATRAVMEARFEAWKEELAGGGRV
ncbi:MAG TPA: hypothetical protein P5137_09920 [Candidatus Brocadiia bacterium]|nr:hypothetical protein [Candidatus Brocadiia bacterium]